MGENDEFVIISDELRKLMNQGDKEVRSLWDIVNKIKISEGLEARENVDGCFVGWEIDGREIYLDKRCRKCEDYKMCKMILQVYEQERR